MIPGARAYDTVMMNPSVRQGVAGRAAILNIWQQRVMCATLLRSLTFTNRLLGVRTWENRARSAFYRTNEVVRIDASAKKIGRCFADTFRKQHPQTKGKRGGGC